MAVESVLNGPIPGQSLTTTPGNFAWEQPPETEQPDEALLYHVSKMSDGQFIEAATMLMKLDIPIEALTDTVITSAVGEGIHSIDVGLIIAPSVHKELVSLAKTTETEYREFFSEEADKEALEKKNLKTLVMHKLKKMSPEEKAPIVSQTAAALSSPEVEAFEDLRDEQGASQEEEGELPQEEGAVLEEEETAEASPDEGMGLMSRGV